jgi:hypothetical protein
MAALDTNISDDRHLARRHRREQPESSWRFALAGLCASLVGIGLARFAYTPLIPALIAAKWFSPSDIIYLGAAGQELPRDARGEKYAGKKIPLQLSDREQASHRHEYCITPSSILP